MEKRDGLWYAIICGNMLLACVLMLLVYVFGTPLPQRFLDVPTAKHIYREMMAHPGNYPFVHAQAIGIERAIDAGILDPDELGFTKEMLDAAAHNALLYDLRARYEMIPLASPDLAQKSADLIYDAVKAGTVTWRELGFTEEDLLSALVEAEIDPGSGILL